MILKSLFVTLVITVALVAAPIERSQAAWPVIDIGAIAQLIQQVNYWKQQITGMSNQLNQLKQTYSALTGSRGMQNLLGITPQARNYLPPNWQELMSVVQNASATYAGLSSKAQAILQANAILSASDLARLSPTHRKLIEDGRNSAAMLQVMGQSAYEQTSQRFGALQQLITSIGSATDEKAIEDLQGRIAAEQTMLQNEATKLETLRQSAEGAAQAREQQVREQTLRGIGSVNTLRPVTY